ncbi:DUF2971 domain-containing protein [Sphingomonas sp. G-3-2-10]|uniref:DUF2971 domain-containing protein n=1 Tax=Sphingomonas sp. G-3-2-10 TaxID=2728838 RepID=UPI00146EE205|nr:DUF2971 domain-containing protein [Sphingomonas sp. G-3-2-10]NML05959.1 DUF2971 domain-containing protein [Sphingomonas sp. G-3-2-10]
MGMFYKFMGGSDEDLIEVFDNAVVKGSVKFTSAASFNDPFEFAFRSVVPEREAYEAWHRTYRPEVTAEQREHGWEALTGKQADWNSGLVPRVTMLERLYVLCLARRWDIHLIWSHYASAHHGFAIRYKPEIVTALAALPDFEMCGDVVYGEAVPDLRWFSEPPEDIVRPVLLTKSLDWAYEAEHRVVLTGPPGKGALFHTVDPELIAGVILGARVPEALVEKALALRKARPDFTIEELGAVRDSYTLTIHQIEDNVRRMRGFL